MKVRFLSRLAETCFILAMVQAALLAINLLFPFGKPWRTPHSETLAHVILHLAPWLSMVLLVALGFYLQRLSNKGRSK